MCARFTLTVDDKALLAEYAANYVEPFTPNYNTAPTQKSSIIIAEKPDEIHQYHFGLVPHWAKDKKVGFSMLNARSETVLEKPSFKPLMEKNKRCLVIVDGFYEWETIGKDKLPYRFTLPDRPIFAFAGLWSQWIDPATKLPYRSFSIMTTEPNELVGKLHDRMPVILTKEEEKIWLTDGVPITDLLGLCDPFPGAEMDMYRVSREVNKVRNNHIGLIQPENSL